MTISPKLGLVVNVVFRVVPNVGERWFRQFFGGANVRQILFFLV